MLDDNHYSGVHNALKLQVEPPFIGGKYYA